MGDAERDRLAVVLGELGVKIDAIHQRLDDYQESHWRQRQEDRQDRTQESEDTATEIRNLWSKVNGVSRKVAAMWGAAMGMGAVAGGVITFFSSLFKAKGSG